MGQPTEKVRGPNGVIYPQKKYGPDLSTADEYGANIGQGGLDDWRSTNQELHQLATEALYRHADIDATAIEISIRDGRLTLSGRVGTVSEKNLAEETVGKIQGIIEVDNQIVVKRLH